YELINVQQLFFLLVNVIKIKMVKSYKRTNNENSFSVLWNPKVLWRINCMVNCVVEFAQLVLHIVPCFFIVVFSDERNIFKNKKLWRSVSEDFYNFIK